MLSSRSQPRQEPQTLLLFSLPGVTSSLCLVSFPAHEFEKCYNGEYGAQVLPNTLEVFSSTSFIEQISMCKKSLNISSQMGENVAEKSI